MEIVKSTEKNYYIIMDQTERTILKQDAERPANYDVKDIPTLIKYILECHIETCKTKGKT